MDNFYEPAISLFSGVDTTVAASAANTVTVGTVVRVRSCPGTFCFLQTSLAGAYPWHFSSPADIQPYFTSYHQYFLFPHNKNLSVSGNHIMGMVPEAVKIFFKRIPEPKKEVNDRILITTAQTMQMIPVLTSKLHSYNGSGIWPGLTCNLFHFFAYACVNKKCK